VHICQFAIFFSALPVASVLNLPRFSHICSGVTQRRPQALNEGNEKTTFFNEKTTFFFVTAVFSELA
jgi:hypothetical protein